MQKLIDTSTAFYGSGNASTTKLFKLTEGSYSGRMLALYSQSPTTIKFSFADPPYTSWSTPTTIAADAADYPVSGCLDSDGNIYVVYSKSGTLELLCRKLTLVSGEWSVGSEVTVYNEKANYFPTLVRQDSGKLDICWTCYDSASGEYSIRHKSSFDNGVSWGGGPSDAGAELLGGASSCFAQLLYLNGRLYCIYTANGATLACRSKDGAAALFNSAQTIYSGSGLDDSLAAAVSESGSLVAVAFGAEDKLWFLEYDLANWSSPYLIAESPALPPRLLFNGAIPYVIYGLTVGGGQTACYYRYKQGSGFNAAIGLHAELSALAGVTLYDADGSPQWFSRTAEAADSGSADVFHPISGRLLQAVGDALYCGAAEKFATLNFHLSTPGDAVGRISWSYYDGSQWVAFTPYSGEYHLDQSSQLVRLWNDTAGAPAGWQRCEVDGESYYWIKIEVTSAYSTGPVGSQITPLGELKYITA